MEWLKTMSLNLKNIAFAFVLSVVVAFLTYVYGQGNIFTLDWHAMINNAVMAGIGSVLVSLGTTRRGNFAGAVPVAESRD